MSEYGKRFGDLKIGESEIAFLAAMSSLRIPARDLAPVAEALKAHLVATSILLERNVEHGPNSAEGVHNV